MAQRGRRRGSSPYAAADRVLALEAMAMVACGTAPADAIATVALRADGGGTPRAKRDRLTKVYALLTAQREAEQREVELTLARQRRLERMHELHRQHEAELGRLMASYPDHQRERETTIAALARLNPADASAVNAAWARLQGPTAALAAIEVEISRLFDEEAVEFPPAAGYPAGFKRPLG